MKRWFKLFKMIPNMILRAVRQVKFNNKLLSRVARHQHLFLFFNLCIVGTDFTQLDGKVARVSHIKSL